MSDHVQSSDALLSCTTKPSESSVRNATEHSLSGYDADDDGDIASHVSDSSVVSNGENEVPTVGESSPALSTETVVPVEEEGYGDSSDSPVEYTELSHMLSSEALAEGDSSSSTSSPVSSPDDAPTNLRRRRVYVESDSSKRARLEL